MPKSSFLAKRKFFIKKPLKKCKVSNLTPYIRQRNVNLTLKITDSEYQWKEFSSFRVSEFCSLNVRSFSSADLH